MPRWWTTRRRRAPSSGHAPYARTASTAWRCTARCCGTSRRRWRCRTWRRRWWRWTGSAHTPGACSEIALACRRSTRQRCGTSSAHYSWTRGARMRTPCAGTSTSPTRTSRRPLHATAPRSAWTPDTTTHGTAWARCTTGRRSSSCRSTTSGTRWASTAAALCCTATWAWRCTRCAAPPTPWTCCAAPSRWTHGTRWLSTSARPCLCRTTASRRRWKSWRRSRRWRRVRRACFSSWERSTKSWTCPTKLW
mmetsp:Transcript_25477/g.63769  ORF Transcript_25477/g.63769 Transcript_25477/m.63769 type:complete len:250 (-) Transcript_25477:1555-2304(-)